MIGQVFLRLVLGMTCEFLEVRPLSSKKKKAIGEEEDGR